MQQCHVHFMMININFFFILATKFSYNWVAIPHALMALSTLMMIIGLLEFVSAQVPYSMKGVILEVVYCSVIGAASLCAVLLIPFQ